MAPQSAAGWLDDAVPPAVVLVLCSSLVDWFHLGPAAWHP